MLCCLIVRVGWKILDSRLRGNDTGKSGHDTRGGDGTRGRGNDIREGELVRGVARMAGDNRVGESSWRVFPPVR